MEYLRWDEKVITDFSEENISNMYDRGYVFTRIGKGVMHQTRLIRIDLSKFKLSSENRRIIKKFDNIKFKQTNLPFSEYKWTVAKLAKDFYDTKFSLGIMSAAKVKDLLTDPTKSNFNKLLIYSKDGADIGYCISYESGSILHYSYPFYDLESIKDMGMGMMLNAIQYSQERGLRYIYLGSLQRPTDTYKLQFTGTEWFDGNIWKDDIAEVKTLLVQGPTLN